MHFKTPDGFGGIQFRRGGPPQILPWPDFTSVSTAIEGLFNLFLPASVFSGLLSACRATDEASGCVGSTGIEAVDIAPFWRYSFIATWYC